MKYKFKRGKNDYYRLRMRDIYLLREYCSKKGDDLLDLLLFVGDGRRLVR